MKPVFPKHLYLFKPRFTTPLLIAIFLIVTLAVTPASATTGDPALINEIFASHTGTDDTEFIEFYGIPGTSLDGVSLIVVEGDSFSPGTIDRRLDFGTSDIIGSNGFFLVGNPVGLAANYGVAPNIAVANNYLENSSLTAALVETASISGGSVSGGEVVLDAVALTDGDAGDVFFFGAPVIGPDGFFFPAGAHRVTDGVDTDTAADWAIGNFFLGSSNTPTSGDVPPPPPPPLVSIMDIQGSGQFSAYDGDVVESWGVVTLYTGNGAHFWLQDPSGDGNAATSDGIFVSGGAFPDEGPKPAVGDFIRIIASVQEQQFGTALPLTRLRNVEFIEVVSSANPLPAPVTLIDLPDNSITEGIDFWEPLEGMLVSVSYGKVVAGTSRFGEFAMIAEADWVPGSGYYPQTKQILIGSLGGEQVDYNPERILVDDSTYRITVMPGDEIYDFVGTVDYTFGNYKLQPASNTANTHNLPSLPVSTRSGGNGNLTITTFNVENLFDLVDDPGKDDIGTGGASNAAALETQLNKLTLAIQGELELPAILVVQEVENQSILQVLGDRVNASAGTSYVATSFETSDGRGIEVGFLWDANRVSLVDAYQLSGPDVEAAFGPASASPGREPLVGVFEFNGQQTTIVGNHFKSKGGDDTLVGVNQPFNRGTEVQRKAQAAAVRSFVDTVLNADPNALLMVTGDLNDFQFSEPGEGADHPIAILEGVYGGVPLTNLVNLEKDAETYSFVFDGNSQVLDHMLVSPALLDLLVGVDFLHFNAGFPAYLESDPNTPILASDHDALEGRFSIK